MLDEAAPDSFDSSKNKQLRYNIDLLNSELKHWADLKKYYNDFMFKFFGFYVLNVGAILSFYITNHNKFQNDLSPIIAFGLWWLIVLGCIVAFALAAHIPNFIYADKVLGLTCGVLRDEFYLINDTDKTEKYRKAQVLNMYPTWKPLTISAFVYSALALMVSIALYWTFLF